MGADPPTRQALLFCFPAPGHHVAQEGPAPSPLLPSPPAGRRIASTVSAVILLRGVLQALGGMAASLQGAACPLMQV